MENSPRNSLLNWCKEKLPYYILGIVFFFCIAQYRGLVSDGTLYTLQAVHFLEPERFANDIVFLYGNQDSFTIFSPLYALFLKLFSICNGALICCAVFHLFLAFAIIYLIDSWTKISHCNRLFFPIALTFLLLYCNFGETRARINDFAFVDPFIAPRNLSIAFGLLGLSTIFKRKFFSISFFIIGSLIHPLMAGWGIPLWFFYYYPKTIYPISIFAALFPLTIFIGKGSFDAIGPNWNEFYKENHFAHFLTFLTFYLYCWKYSINKYIKKASLSLFLVVAIAFYWLVVGNQINHIFLGQVQTFRIEWLCITSSFALFCCLLFEKYISDYRKQNFNIKTIALPLFAIAFWIDSVLIVYFIVLFFIYIKYHSQLNFSRLSAVFNIFQILGLIGIASVVILQQISIGGSENYALRNAEMALAFSMCLIVLANKLAFPSKTIFPMISLSIVGLSSVTQSELHLANDYSCSLILYASILLWAFSFKKNILIKVVPLLWLLPFAMTHYDNRISQQILAEKQIDYFFEHPVFPEIRDRGRIFFCTGGFLSSHSRIQFVSGTYLDYQSRTGAIFYKKQYQEAIHRINMLFFQDSSTILKSENADLIIEFEKLHSQNKLTKTAKFLCKNNEISHIVTDIPELDFPLQQIQSTPEVQKNLFLYSCK